MTMNAIVSIRTFLTVVKAHGLGVDGGVGLQSALIISTIELYFSCFGVISMCLICVYI
jgi:hypothetical protein